jgi:hypothetical protein
VAKILGGTTTYHGMEHRYLNGYDFGEQLRCVDDGTEIQIELTDDEGNEP